MRQRIITLLIGMALGMALLSWSSAAGSTTLTAIPSRQTFYLNGERIDLTAYSINGNNYVKLRDVGQAVDFGVIYDGKTNSVYIDPDSPYIEEVTPPAQTTTSPSTDITEESVQASLEQLKQTYPTGTVYPTPYRSTSNGPYSRGIHCSGWATLCSDAAFGSLPWRRVNRPSWNQIRPGDVIEYENDKSYHAVVVVSKTAEFIVVTESSDNNKTNWGGQYFRWWLEEQPEYVLYTRYPE